MARGAAPAGRGQVGHSESLGGPTAFGLREQRAGVRERDFAPFVVVQETETPETQVRHNNSVVSSWAVASRGATYVGVRTAYASDGVRGWFLVLKHSPISLSA